MQTTKIKVLTLAGCLAVLALCGCSHTETEVRTPSFDQQIAAPPVNYNTGSIWQASSTGIAEDVKARRRGDIITVVISENATASKQASTGTARSSSLGGGINNLFGLEKTGIKNWLDLANLINATYDSKFAGSGSTSRQETLNATISAKVVEVIPNGNFMIEGRRSVKVNNEDQIIVLTGTIRPRDISADNSVSSALIADARIAYSGKGVISDRQNPGWLLNLFDKIWPF
ncbi:flagellar basal body L-ring protein FlgH [Geomesophilobacter sediminis]|uniref:Flagellar L-ring protein n=1 Tax=Geomesophilobacter sediminis TaxID=2798584 RepID=A0A8J7JC26_9BACT|nr:flagellar basal body L-ring protein FlgH [Geomesophilobacter sediminis]MBJ6724821.1 flagellar basal body L-ring protein FlgH [Geomesophilobacter sediminis]